MPRPLAGYSLNGVTLTAPGSVPGSAVDDPDDGHHDRAVVGVEGTEEHHLLPGGQPDPGDAAAGAALRADAAGGEVQQLGVGGDEAELLLAGAQLDRADHLVAVGEPDDLPARRGWPSTSGLTRLTTPCAGAQRAARGCRSPSVVSASTRSPGSSGEELADRRAALQVRVVRGRRQRGQVEHVEP